MKCLIYVLYCVTMFNVINCQFDDSTYLGDVKLRTIMKIHMLCPNKEFDEIEEALSELVRCVDYANETNTVCSIIKEALTECSKPVTNLLETCLPERARDLPRFVYDIFTSLNDYICKSDGEHIMELINPCGVTPDSASKSCYRRAVAKIQQYSNKPPSKAEVCEALTSLKPCYFKMVKESCTNHVAKESYTGIYEAIIKPCRAEENEIEWMNAV